MDGVGDEEMGMLPGTEVPGTGTGCAPVPGGLAIGIALEGELPIFMALSPETGGEVAEVEEGTAFLV